MDGSTELAKNVVNNYDIYSDYSAVLESILVFAGLFSGVLSAVLVEVRKGLQEDIRVLLRILHELEKSNELSNSAESFKPAATQVSVNLLWFLSLTFSMMGAFGAMLAKRFGKRWVVEATFVQWVRMAPKEDLEEFFGIVENKLPVNPKARTTWLLAPKTWEKVKEQEDDHKKFAPKFMSLVTIVTSLVYGAFVLFFAGLVVLLYNDNRMIGICISGMIGSLGRLLASFMIFDSVASILTRLISSLVLL